jgi:predicted PurR-regulated permease PerM
VQHLRATREPSMPRNPETPQPVTPWTREIARRTAVQMAVVLAAVLLTLLLWVGRHVVLLLFAAGLVAVALQGLAAPLARRARVHYGLALAAVTLAIAGLLVLTGMLIGPQIAEQVSVLRRDLPAALDRLEGRLDDYAWGQEAIQRTEELQRTVSGLGGHELWTRIAGVFSTVFGAVGAFVVIVVTGIYLAAGAPRYVDAVVRLFPKDRRPRMEEVVRRAVHYMRFWLLGRFATMVFVGVTTGIGLALLGMPLALTFAILAGLLDFVPNFGPLLAAAPVVLLALVQSPTQALWVVALYVAIQTLEAYVVSPLVERRTVSLEPAGVIAAQLLGAVVLGAAGVVLATPMTAVVLVLVRMLYLEDVLGEKDATARSAAGQTKGVRRAAKVDAAE